MNQFDCPMHGHTTLRYVDDYGVYQMQCGCSLLPVPSITLNPTVPHEVIMLFMLHALGARPMP